MEEIYCFKTLIFFEKLVFELLPRLCVTVSCSTGLCALICSTPSFFILVVVVYQYVSACMHFTMHHFLWPTSISGLVCVSPGASWVTDVCYLTPSELAQCDCHGQRGASHRPDCLCEPQGFGGVGRQYQACAGPQKPYLAFLSRGADGTQRYDLWEEISAAFGVLALIGSQASCTPREEMNECASHSTLPARVSACLSAACLPS